MHACPTPWLVLAGVVLALVPARSAQASACCGSSYGLGARLASAEDGAATVMIRNSAATGSWDADAGFRRARSLRHELRMDVAGQLRLNRYFQVGATAPFVSSTRIGLKDADHGFGVGDAGVSGRLDVIPVGGERGLPGVAFTLGMTLPTGRTPQDSTSRMGADITGAGLWEVRPGVTLERSWLNGWFVVASGALALRLPGTDARGRWQQYQPRLNLTVAGGPTLRRSLALAVGVTHEREAALLIDHVPVPRGERARTSALAIAAWELSEHWTVMATSQAEVPISRLGRNEETLVSFSVGIRRVWLDYD